MNRKITLSQCERLFHLPVEQAAVKLGVSRPTISRVMRQNGYKRWPYRTIAAQSKRQPSNDIHSNIPVSPLLPRNQASSSANTYHSNSPPRPPPRRSAAASIPCPPPRRSEQAKRFNSRSVAQYQHRQQQQQRTVVSTNKLLNSPASSTSDETMDESDDDGLNGNINGNSHGDDSGDTAAKTEHSLDIAGIESSSDCTKVAPSPPFTANTRNVLPKKKFRLVRAITDEISSQCTKIVPPPVPSPSAAKKDSMNGVELLAFVCENAPRRSSARLQALAAKSNHSSCAEDSKEGSNGSKISFHTPAPSATKSKFLENFISSAASLGRVKFTVHGTDNGKLFINGKFGQQLRLMKIEGRSTLSIMNEGFSLAARIDLGRVHYIDLIETMSAEQKTIRFVRILQEDLGIVVAATLTSSTPAHIEFKSLRNKYGGTMKLPLV